MGHRIQDVLQYGWSTLHGSESGREMVPILLQEITLMSRIERKYCLISTSCLTGLFDISILLHI